VIRPQVSDRGGSEMRRDRQTCRRETGKINTGEFGADFT
jgi:hypothetical protein